MKIILLFIPFILFPSFSQDVPSNKRKLSNIEWEQFDHKDSISLYKEKNPEGDLVAVRGETRINAPAETILSILVNADFESQKEWVPDLIEFRTLSSNTVFNRVIYVHVDIMWPARDRDFVYAAKISADTDENRVTLDYRSVKGVKAEKKRVVRGSMKTMFILSKISDSTAILDFRSLVDPGGIVPDFIVNITQRKYSYDMVRKIRERVHRLRDKTEIHEEFKDLFTKR